MPSAVFSDLFITNQGSAMTASAWASSGVITITSVQFGSGFPGGADNIPGYTALKSPVCNGQITGQNVLVSGQFTVRTNLAGTAIPSTFQINEIGVWASFSGGASQLVAYCSTGAATGDTLTLGSPIVKDYAILVTFAQGVITTVNISLLQTVGLHAPNHLDNGIDPIPYPTTARAGLLLASPNNVGMGLVGSNPPSWSPIQRVISVAQTLYVSTTGNNSTAIPNDITHPWASIQGAANYLSQYVILETVPVTIVLAAGTYTGAAGAAVISHPNAGQITITGPTNPDFAFQLGTITGSSYAWSVQLTSVSSLTGIAVGLFVLIWSPPGLANVAETLLVGMFQVTAVSGSTVTVNVPYYGTTFPSMAGFTTGTGTPLSALLQVPQNGVGLNLYKGIGTVQYIGLYAVALSGNNFNTVGLYLSGSGSLNRCGVFDFRTSGVSNPSCAGFQLGNGSSQLICCCATLCGMGVQVGNGSASFTFGGFCHNVYYGVWPIGSGVVFALDSVFVGGNVQAGIYAGISSGIICQLSQGGGVQQPGSWFVSYNAGPGVILNGLCTTTSSNSSCQIVVNANTTYDLEVTGMSISQAVITGSRIFNQAENVLTVNGLIIN